jgi:6-phospho-beta-glucosidase
VACELIASIQNNKGTEMVVSMKNNGALTDLPDDCVVEVTGAVTSHGVESYTWGKFDPATRSLLQLMKGMEQAVIEAAITGDYNKALHAFTINPLIPSGKMAKTLLDELLIAHKDYLPQFNEAIERIEKKQPETVAYVNKLMESN